MGVSRLDIAFVHDISSDNKLLPTSWQEQFEIALEGAFPALSRMREEGIIKGWGVGVNTPEPILRVMQESDPDVCLLASQYSLINHANALNNVFPVARLRNVKYQLVETVSGWLYVPTGNLFRRAVALPVAGYDYNSDWTPLLAGLSPLRTHAGAGAAESKELRNKPSMS
jgi:hypothetical protein